MSKFSAKQLAILILTATALSANAQVYSPNNYRSFCRTGFVGIEGDLFRPYLENLLGGEAISLSDERVLHNYWSDPDYELGYRIFAGKYFCDKDYVAVDYSHYDDSDHQHLPINVFEVDHRDVKVRVHYDEANAVLGHSFATCTWNVNVFGGLQYARVKRDKHTFVDFLGDEPGFFDEYNSVRFNGFGPVIGFEAAYNLPCSLQIVGGAWDSILVDKLKLNANINTQDGITAINTYDDRKILANNFYAKLGLAYITCVNCVKVRIEGGYKVHSFYAPDGGEGSTIRLSKASHSFGFGTAGPYLGVSMGF